MHSLPFQIWAPSAATVGQIRGVARLAKRTTGVAIIVIDYVGLTKPTDLRRPRHEQISEVVGSLKTLAKDLDVPVLALCQLNREAEDKRPTLAMLRDSGSVEQDADTVVFLHRQRDSTEVEFHVAKHRHGDTGMLKLEFVARETRFIEPEVPRIHELDQWNLLLGAMATEIACSENPLTLRGLFYRVVSAGAMPSTDSKHYSRLGRIMKRLREHGTVPFQCIVDNLRNTIKPSSWSGLDDFAQAVRDAYRKDLWSRLPKYVHIFCEKDAIAGVVSPVTREYDVALSPIRGYVSLSFAHEVAEQWNQIDKPIHAYYVGDFDPSGFDLERRAKLERYCNHSFEWDRLGVNFDDFATFDLIHVLDTFFDGALDDALAAHMAKKEKHITPKQYQRMISLIEKAREEE